MERLNKVKKYLPYLFSIMLALVLSIPAQAKPVQYPVGYADVSLILYADMNLNGYLDVDVYDYCILSDSNPKHSWIMEQSSTGIDYLVSTPLGNDFLVDDYSDYLTCVYGGHKFDVPSNQYYDLSGCGPYSEHVYIGYTDEGVQLNVAHKTTGTDPSC